MKATKVNGLWFYSSFLQTLRRLGMRQPDTQTPVITPPEALEAVLRGAHDSLCISAKARMFCPKSLISQVFIQEATLLAYFFTN